MLNLEKYSGLPIQMRDDYSLVFEKGLPAVKPQIREFSTMKNYLKNPSATYGRRDVYRVYRDVAKVEDAQTFHNHGLQYDITVIPPGKIGEEFVKTIGHYHDYKPGTQARLPEVYEVIYGSAFVLIQSASADLERLERVYLISVERGEKFIIPPGFGHVSVNPADDVLILANIQVWKNAGIYEPYESRNGAAYYVVESERLSARGQTTPETKFVPNLNYNQLPQLQQVKPRELPQYNLRSAWPMYSAALQDLKNLDFVVNPENYLDELDPEKLFKF